MRRAYRALLRLYPREYRVQFAEEMLAVFTRAAEERRAQGWLPFAKFAVNECAGLLSGACGEQQWRVRLAPVLGGIVLAAVLHTAFFAATLRMLHRTAAVVGRSTIPPADPLAGAVTLGVFAVVSLFCLLPLFFLLSMQLTWRRR
jgi:hypothetical protein